MHAERGDGEEVDDDDGQIEWVDAHERLKREPRIVAGRTKVKECVWRAGAEGLGISR